ncbi:MAG: hypothetical protein QM800_03015 [Paludibacter sp.]
MNHFQLSKLNTYRLISIETKNNQAEASLIPAFIKGVARLEAMIVEIDQLSVEQSTNITGIAKEKNAFLNELEGYLVDVAGAVYAHAQLQNNKTLREIVNFKQGAVAKMQQSAVINAAAIVLEEATKLTPEELAEGGISAEEMTQFANTLAQVKAAANEPRAAIIDRTGHTQRMADLFAEASDLKKNTLDRLATQFVRKAPDFHYKYQAAATVIYRHKSKTPAATPEVEA